MKKLTILILLFTAPWISAQQLFKSTIQLNHEALAVTERSALVAEINSQLLIDESQQFDLQLPNGVKATAVFNRLEQHGKNRFSWFGHLKGQPQEQLSISVVDGFYAGALFTKAAVFEFSAAQQNHMRIAELSPTGFPECDGEVETPAIETNEHNNLDEVQGDVEFGGTVNFDVMVLYTPQARNGAGGTAAIEAVAQAAVDAMNISLNNSEVDAQANLSYTGVINYNDSGTTSEDLSWLRTSSRANELRTAYGADMVGLLVNSGGCGTGYVMRNPGSSFNGFAYQVTKRSCAVGNLTFAHEFGHNMGLEHNPENSNVGPEDASNPWSYGHYHSGSYRTVMSYSAPCTGGCGRRQHFSNPDIQFNSLDTGIEGERDNVRTLNQTAAIIAAFRAPANDTIFEDGF